LHKGRLMEGHTCWEGLRHDAFTLGNQLWSKSAIVSKVLQKYSTRQCM
jgi:hypothetical protein